MPWGRVRVSVSVVAVAVLGLSACGGLAAEEGIDPEASRTPTAGHDHTNDAGRPNP